MFVAELGEEGYAGLEVRVTPVRTEIIIKATKTQGVLGEKGRRVRELTSAIQKRFNFPEGNVELFAERVANRGLCAQAQAESLRFKLLGGLAVRRACYGVLRFIMESGAKGCEIQVSGKLRGQRAKSMKFRDGYMIKSGDACNYYVDHSIRHLQLKQGILGIQVWIMLPHDPTGKEGPQKTLSDVITIHSPKPEDEQTTPAKQGTVEPNRNQNTNNNQQQQYQQEVQNNNQQQDNQNNNQQQQQNNNQDQRNNQQQFNNNQINNQQQQQNNQQQNRQ